MITYPNNPLDYVSTPWMNDGIGWLWAVRGESGKWGRAPSSGTLTSAYTVSINPPADTTLPWLDAEYGTLNYWYDDGTSGGVWVEVSGGAGPEGTPYSATVTNSTAATGSTLTFLADVDETIFLQSVTNSPVAAITLVLPAASDSHVGQVKMFISSKNVTALTVSVSGGGTISGTTLTTAAANESYAFQCVSVSGAGTWLRIS